MNNSVALRTLLFKEIRRFARIWPQTLLPPAITTSLYFLIFGKLIGERIGVVNGVSYMNYIVPGVILMSVISHSYSNVVSSFYSTKFQRHIEELLVAPVSNWVILAGYIGGGIARGVLVGCVVTAISLMFTEITVVNWWVAVSVFVLTATLFSLAGFINAIFADSFDDIAIIPNFVLTPLSYLGGVFYSVSMLPDIWQKIAMVNPILYMINAFRYGLIGVSDVDVYLAVMMTVGFIVLLIVFCLILLAKGVGIKN
ncbi:ABC transporter permease [methanotrophic endosymbiont of Bathymodiolus puteoserpentis (Logatchev)]|jgi:ABC-2 type transport system permease protein|uniref:ABC transporter permease n=1 Tax=methanotrophic endosymbiont of Bathymodiolus puteoserpentis (Logatchev) TaxID=343235 RepID=UPI0013CB4595|nr:ABC transporter permease [methanotrophic endosymbiont of Bathymodiolus puteoserpentis (Logatchev)]SHE19219.1 ABC-type multidrug transport system, permease component [methanotrophic endosymbiont of Bathymodiolus puteoserpentis (Logatchev)]